MLVKVRWLCLDIGAERVGVAMCDPSEVAITRLPAVAYRGPNSLAAHIAALCRKYAVEGLVVGVPHTTSCGGRGGARIAAVVTALRSCLALPVEEENECGSTREAQERLAAEGVSPRKWAHLVDGVAAEIILERYLAGRLARGRGGAPLTS